MNFMAYELHLNKEPVLGAFRDHQMASWLLDELCSHWCLPRFLHL